MDPKEIAAAVPSRMQEEYAIALAEMPSVVRDSVASDERLNVFVFSFFKLGYCRGMLHGAEASYDLVNTAPPAADHPADHLPPDRQGGNK
jgi:hypothetical protein